MGERLRVFVLCCVVSDTSPVEASGRIVVRSKTAGVDALRVPYQVSVLRGGVDYDRNKTLFFTGHPQIWNITRFIPVTNMFHSMLIIYNASVPKEMEPFFTVSISCRSLHHS